MTVVRDPRRKAGSSRPVSLSICLNRVKGRYFVHTSSHLATGGHLSRSVGYYEAIIPVHPASDMSFH